MGDCTCRWRRPSVPAGRWGAGRPRSAPSLWRSRSSRSQRQHLLWRPPRSNVQTTWHAYELAGIGAGRKWLVVFRYSLGYSFMPFLQQCTLHSHDFTIENAHTLDLKIMTEPAYVYSPCSIQKKSRSIQCFSACENFPDSCKPGITMYLRTSCWYEVQLKVQFCTSAWWCSFTLELHIIITAPG